VRIESDVQPALRHRAIVRVTGGLDDTVIDATESPKSANGIKFMEYSSRSLAKSIRKALALYAEPGSLKHYQINGMAADFSWDRTALDYTSLYARTMKKTRSTGAPRLPVTYAANLDSGLEM